LDFSDESKHEENYDLLLQSLKKKLATMEAPASPTYPASKEAKRLEEQGNHYTDVAVEINLGVRGAPLHVIGWKGIEIDDIYKGFENVNCLVTERSFDSPPTLQFRQNVFNVIVADAELLERYASLGAVQNLQHLTTRVRDMFDQDPISLIKNRISQKSPIGGLYDNHLHGIPLQFGFNELLVNVDGLNKGALKEKFDRATKRVVTNLRYKDFDIKNLLETDQVKKIGLWNWYLPTFCHLLMCDGAQSDLTSVAQFYEKTTTLKKDDQTIKNFSAELVALAEKYRSKIILLRSLEQASRALLRGEIGVMFGGSSALLEQGSVAMPLQGSIKLVIPQEGLFMWVNCGAVLNPPMGRYEDLLVYWLCPETQVRLWKCNTAFKGFPVRKDSILRILTEEPFHNSFLTLARTMTRDEARWFLDREQSGVDPNSRAFFDTLRSQRRGGVNEVPVSFRPFPNTQWRHWTETWEAIVSTLKGAATEKVS